MTARWRSRSWPAKNTKHAAIVLISTIMCSACATARYQGTVAIEGQHQLDPGPSSESSRYAVRPPICDIDLPMPVYPPELLGPEAGIVRVRVDFLLTDNGTPEQIVASFPAVTGEEAASDASTGEGPSRQDDAPRSAVDRTLFLQAAEAAISQWRCAAAWRRAFPTESVNWVPLSYQTWVVFRFDAERVDGKASIEGGTSS